MFLISFHTLHAQVDGQEWTFAENSLERPTILLLTKKKTSDRKMPSTPKTYSILNFQPELNTKNWLVTSNKNFGLKL